jgi:hypothetical protein
MIKITAIFDNKIASPETPQNFVKKFYLTEMGQNDCEYLLVEQGDNYPEIDAANSGRAHLPSPLELKEKEAKNRESRAAAIRMVYNNFLNETLLDQIVSNGWHGAVSETLYKEQELINSWFRESGWEPVFTSDKSMAFDKKYLLKLTPIVIGDRHA